MNDFIAFVQNKYIYVPFLLWFGIQLFKVIWDLVATHKFNFKRILGAGGMPSSHSAVVTSLATMIGLSQGIESPIFAVAVIFAFVVPESLMNKSSSTPSLSGEKNCGAV